MAHQDKPPAKEIAGCLIRLWCLFVTAPIWLILLYAILSSLEATPTYAWVLYWVYVPSILTGHIIGLIVFLFLDES